MVHILLKTHPSAEMVHILLKTHPSAHEGAPQHAGLQSPAAAAVELAKHCHQLCPVELLT